MKLKPSVGDSTFLEGGVLVSSSCPKNEVGGLYAGIVFVLGVHHEIPRNIY